jgi:aldose 1-epimerase
MVHNKEIIELSCGPLSLALAPACGGSIHAFRLRQPDKTVELMRPAPADGPGSRDVLNMACFPLVPFSNRIENGTFAYDGREIALARSLTLPDSHPLHGHGWENPWEVSALDNTAATLVYTHSADAPDGWPWTYKAVQEFTLTASSLTVTLAVNNLGDRKMPCGLGLHPYFPGNRETRVYAGLKGIWLTDEHCIPVDHVAIPTEWDFNKNINPLEPVIDNCFTGWNGNAVISQPGLQLTMTHSGPLHTLVIYTPENENFFCLEPVSNITNAFNMPSDSNTGTIELAPGEEYKVTVNFEVKIKDT